MNVTPSDSYSDGTLFGGCDRLVSRAKVIENQVMAILTISISSDSSEESVGTPSGRFYPCGYTTYYQILPALFGVRP
ncbi:hypothetical protein Tco_0200612 [Tanacetum coccineum]